MDLLKIALAHKPYFAPGAGWHYSNTNYILLGMIVEKVTHRPWASVVARRIAAHPGIPAHPYLRPAFRAVVTGFGVGLADLGKSWIMYGPNAPTANRTLPTVNSA